MKDHSPDAVLLLEDGSLFEGRSVSAGTRFGEVVFNTSMTGYQEILNGSFLSLLTVLPASTGAQEAIESGVDGIVLSNGPGDPEPPA